MSDEELLAEAKRRYPIGTVFKSSLNKTAQSIVTTGKVYWWRKPSDICIDREGGYSVYTDGEWAEIISKPEPENKIINNYQIY